MTDSKTPKNLPCVIIKKAVETPSPTNEDSSMDERSSVTSWASSSYTEESFHLCSFCGRKCYDSRGETSEDDEYDSNNTYTISEVDSFDMSDTINSSTGSGYISMDGSSSMEESRRNSEEGSDTSSYYCDRSASSSSCSDTEDSYSGFVGENDSNFTLLTEKECWYEEAGLLDLEE